MLIKLLKVHLKPYQGAVIAVVLLQLVQTMATLYLPSLNARIIDDGVVKGDTDEILRLGGVMLAVSLVQVVAAIIAVYYGSRTAMAFGRDVRERLFGQVQTFSAQEVAKFGAPTLITRTTNDVQQVQMVTHDDVHHDDHGADHAGRRRDHGDARGRRPVRRSCCSPCRCSA